MPLLTSLADEVVALDLGRVVVRGKPDEVVRDPRVVAAYLGSGQDAVARSGALSPTPVRQRRAPRPAANSTRKATAKKTTTKKTTTKQTTPRPRRRTP
jgi:ABC-type sulfate/molybdate transport systems ATPase subunit